jgi:hypothetical protein
VRNRPRFHRTIFSLTYLSCGSDHASLTLTSQPVQSWAPIPKASRSISRRQRSAEAVWRIIAGWRARVIDSASRGEVGQPEPPSIAASWDRLTSDLSGVSFRRSPEPPDDNTSSGVNLSHSSAPVLSRFAGPDSRKYAPTDEYY